MFKKIIQQYFTFNKRETREILFLVFFISLFIGFNSWFSNLEISHKNELTKQDSIDIENFYAHLKKEEEKPYLNRLDKYIVNLYDSIDLFSFNPNTCTKKDFLKLGLTEKQSNNVLNYRKRGGKFITKEDFQKIYSIRYKQYQILAPFIQIPKQDTTKTKGIKQSNSNSTQFKFNPNTISFDSLKLLGINDKIAQRIQKYRQKVGLFKQKSDLQKVYGFDSLTYNRLATYIQLPETYIPTVEHFDLNNIEAKTLINNFKVDAKFAFRLTNYRNKLGGFYSKNQVFEVFEIDSLEAIKIIKNTDLDPFECTKININLPSSELKKHPYINYKNCKRIDSYKLQNGAFNSIKDIEQSGVFLPKEWEKVKHYLNVK